LPAGEASTTVASTKVRAISARNDVAIVQSEGARVVLM
jgi:hypothetical protein